MRYWLFSLLAPLWFVAAEAAGPSPPDEKPKPAPLSPAAAALLRFSEPVNGLVGRIEGLTSEYAFGDVLLVRLENRGATPLEVPARNPSDPKMQSPFTLYGRSYGEWRLVPWRLEEQRWGRSSVSFSTDPTPPTVLLQPGESVMAYLGGYFARKGLYDRDHIDGLAELTVVLHRTQQLGGRNLWTGTLQTPPYPIYSGEKLQRELAGQVPMPTHFPPFRHERLHTLSGPRDECEFEKLRTANKPRLYQLYLYQPEQVARELEKRVVAENDAELRDFCTVYMYRFAATGRDAEGKAIAPRRSVSFRANSDAVKALDERRRLDGPRWRPTAEWVADALLDALQKAPSPGILAALGELQCHKAVPLIEKLARTPEYRVSAARALGEIGDPRSAAVLLEILPAAAAERDEPSKPWNLDVAGYPVAEALAKLKAQEAVPALIELAKKSDGDSHYVEALGTLGDARAIPPLLELLKALGQREYSHAFYVLVQALVSLRAKEAVPVLLGHVDWPGCVEALAELGDRQAIPALETLAAAKGSNYVEAVAALAKLQGRDPSKSCALLADKSLTERHISRIRWILCESHQRSAVPHLVDIVRNEPDCRLVLGCIYGLGGIRDPAAVEALIGCFDLDYTKKTREPLGMYREASPADYPREIALSLRRLTGANIGTNKAHWQKWWNEEGKKGEWLRNTAHGTE